MAASNKAWNKIFKRYFSDHDFDKEPAVLTADMIKDTTKGFRETKDKEVRILCKQDSREDRPKVFKDNGLFILPVKNGIYNIIRGEGYVDIPEIKEKAEVYDPKLDFSLETSEVGDSEMQHLDYAYAVSIIRTFMNDDSLVLTIRGRKYTPEFNFKVGKYSIKVSSVQTEVDAGYEGRNSVVLVEAKNSSTNNVIIRQLYYPFMQWQTHTSKKVSTIFFEKRGLTYLIWHFGFSDPKDYNSVKLIGSKKFLIN